MHHVVSGYQLLIEQKVDRIARICLTHSFPIQDIHMFSGQMDCTHEEIEFLEAYLKSINYNDYDKLIQLCDALDDARGIGIIDLRLMDVAKRRGIN